ncbi:flavin reductase family protein [Streptomyces sp. NBC_01438]|uniref:flavin reductase family protein n=1 Tax=Streptomyces sp. NBC_01438 TaxID=2903866 RepID=UPI0032500DF9
MLPERVFRDLMSGVCGPVTVVTTAEKETPFGMTVSAFASLSLDPPLVTVAIDRRSTLLAAIQRVGRFGINVLAHEQAATATTFARRDIDRFTEVAWEMDQGLPRLPDAPGWLACDLDRAVEGGDHLLLIGTVTSADSRTAAPLVYGHRTFGTHSAYATDGLGATA